MEVSLGLPRRPCKSWEDVTPSDERKASRPKVHFAEKANNENNAKDRKSETHSETSAVGSPSEILGKV